MSNSSARSCTNVWNAASMSTGEQTSADISVIPNDVAAAFGGFEMEHIQALLGFCRRTQRHDPTCHRSLALAHEEPRFDHLSGRRTHQELPSRHFSNAPNGQETRTRGKTTRRVAQRRGRRLRGLMVQSPARRNSPYREISINGFPVSGEICPKHAPGLEAQGRGPAQRWQLSGGKRRAPGGLHTVVCPVE